MRHRFAVTNWLTAAYRTVQLVARQAVHLGAHAAAQGRDRRGGRDRHQRPVPPRQRDGRERPRAPARSSRSCVVAVILLQTSVTLGLVVLIGVPLLMLAIGPLLKPLQRRNLDQREMMGQLSNPPPTSSSGLRVLRGIGGEQVFHDALRRRVAEGPPRRACEVARLQSVLDALQVLPARASSSCSWSGSVRASRSQGRITPGELVAFYGYAAFLMIPLRTATEFANKLDPRAASPRAGSAGCSRSSPRSTTRPCAAARPAAGLPTWSTCRTGLRVPPGLLTAIVSEPPDDWPPRSPTGSG